MTEILDESAVSEIEDRANAATEGPWTWTYHPNTPDFPNDVIALASDRAEKDVLLCTGNDDGSWGEISEPDAALIAHAREDIPALCATVKHLRAQVDKFSTLADERHDLLSAERRENDQLRQQRAQLSGRVEQLRQCVVDIGKENADLQSQLEQLRATLAQVEQERDRILQLYNSAWLWVQQRVKHPNSGLPPAAMTLIEMLPLLNQRVVQLCKDKAADYADDPKVAHVLRAIAGKLEKL